MKAPNQVCEHTGRLIYGIIHLLAVLKGLPGKLFQFLLHAFMILHNRIQSPWGTSNMIINCIINQHLKTAIIIKFVVIVVIVDVEIVYPVKGPGRLHNYCNISKQPKMVCQENIIYHEANNNEPAKSRCPQRCLLPNHYEASKCVNNLSIVYGSRPFQHQPTSSVSTSSTIEQ